MFRFVLIVLTALLPSVRSHAAELVVKVAALGGGIINGVGNTTQNAMTSPSGNPGAYLTTALQACGGCTFSVYTTKEVDDMVQGLGQKLESVRTDSTRPSNQVVIERILRDSALMKKLTDAIRNDVAKEYGQKIKDLETRVQDLQRKLDGLGIKQ